MFSFTLYKDEEKLYITLYKNIRDEIISNRFNKGDKLPSIRDISKHYNISKNTIEHSLEQLVLEGYLIVRPRSGYYIASFENNEYINFNAINKNSNEAKSSNTQYNGRYNKPFIDEVFIREWKKSYNNVFYSNKIFSEANIYGEEELKSQIVQFVNQYRGITCNEEQVLIGAGISSIFYNYAFLFDKIFDTIAVEKPGFIQIQNTLSALKINMIYIDVNKKGIDIKKLKESRANGVYITPAHQYPTGSIIPIEERASLLKWAIDNDSYILEDDYDSLLRYDRRPIPPICALDKHDRVIYFGSFSDIFIPSIRISYMVLPEHLLEIVYQNKDKIKQSTSKIDQLVLADYFDKGYFERNLRRFIKRSNGVPPLIGPKPKLVMI